MGGAGMGSTCGAEFVVTVAKEKPIKNKDIQKKCIKNEDLKLI